MSKRRKKKKYPATLKLLCTVTVLLLGAAGYTFGNDGITPISDTASQSAQGVYQDAQTDLSANAGDLTVHFVDIGQGDCMVLTQDDHAMIIDAGDNDKGTVVQSYLEYLGISELDYAILTHPDADHIGGADVVLYKFDCDRVLMPDHSSDTKTYEDVIRVIDDKQIPVEHPVPGDTYTFGNASFTVLSPSKEYKDNNNNSIVIRLTYGLPLSADVLKLGHHGSSSSTSDDFLSAVDPTWAVISCAEGNKYGHPHAETMNKLRASGISVFRTDEQGTITATTDGTTITWNASPSETWQTGEGRSSE